MNQMEIVRTGKIEDFNKLVWGWDKDPVTQKCFIEGIQNGEQEFLVIEQNGMLIGEIHIIWRSKDLDEADGINRAYLCAYRVHPDYQGKGFGKKLMENAIKRVQEKGFTEITIGIQVTDYYHTWQGKISGWLKASFKSIVSKIIGVPVYDSQKGVERLRTMYNNWGFNQYIKTQCRDNHNFNNNGYPKKAKAELYLMHLPGV